MAAVAVSLVGRQPAQALVVCLVEHPVEAQVVCLGVGTRAGAAGACLVVVPHNPLVVFSVEHQPHLEVAEGYSETPVLQLAPEAYSAIPARLPRAPVACLEDHLRITIRLEEDFLVEALRQAALVVRERKKDRFNDLNLLEGLFGNSSSPSTGGSLFGGSSATQCTRHFLFFAT